MFKYLRFLNMNRYNPTPRRLGTWITQILMILMLPGSLIGVSPTSVLAAAAMFVDDILLTRWLGTRVHEMVPGDNQQMHGGNGCDVLDDDHLVVLIHLSGRNRTSDYLAKDTGVHRQASLTVK